MCFGLVRDICSFLCAAVCVYFFLKSQSSCLVSVPISLLTAHLPGVLPVFVTTLICNLSDYSRRHWALSQWAWHLKVSCAELWTADQTTKLRTIEMNANTVVYTHQGHMKTTENKESLHSMLLSPVLKLLLGSLIIFSFRHWKTNLYSVSHASWLES